MKSILKASINCEKIGHRAADCRLNQRRPGEHTVNPPAATKDQEQQWTCYKRAQVTSVPPTRSVWKESTGATQGQDKENHLQGIFELET